MDDCTFFWGAFTEISLAVFRLLYVISNYGSCEVEVRHIPVEQPELLGQGTPYFCHVPSLLYEADLQRWPHLSFSEW